MSLVSLSLRLLVFYSLALRDAATTPPAPTPPPAAAPTIEQNVNASPFPPVKPHHFPKISRTTYGQMAISPLVTRAANKKSKPARSITASNRSFANIPAEPSLAALFSRGREANSIRFALICAASVTVLAALLEAMQLALPNRSADWRDTLHAALGALTFHVSSSALSPQVSSLRYLRFTQVSGFKLHPSQQIPALPLKLPRPRQPNWGNHPTPDILTFLRMLEYLSLPQAPDRHMDLLP